VGYGLTFGSSRSGERSQPGRVILADVIPVQDLGAYPCSWEATTPTGHGAKPRTAGHTVVAQSSIASVTVCAP